MENYCRKRLVVASTTQCGVEIRYGLLPFRPYKQPLAADALGLWCMRFPVWHKRQLIAPVGVSLKGA